MRRVNEICPLCGKKNIGLDLKETGGLYECEQCGQIISVRYGDYNILHSAVLVRDIRRTAV